jgi:hypothetical protein
VDYAKGEDEEAALGDGGNGGYHYTIVGYGGYGGVRG